MRVRFGPWTPDAPDLDQSGLEDAVNCLPLEGGDYGSFPSAVTNASATSLTLTVAGALYLGAGSTVVGTATKLYRNNGAAYEFTDVSRTATYTACGRWTFASFGTTTYAVNDVAVTMQVRPGGANFRDQSASASAPAATVICAVRDFMFANDTADFFRVHWCQQNNPQRWTPSARLQSDSQVLPGSGTVRFMTGGEFATIFTGDSVWRASYVGSPIIFRFDEVAPGVGYIAAAARYQNLTFFLTRGGFHVFDGQQVHRIGANKVDDYFFSTLTAVGPNENTIIDPINKLYVMAYKAEGSAAPNRLLMYHWESQRWTRADFTTEQLIGVDLSGVKVGFAGFNASHLYTSLTGPSQTATFITGEAQLVEDRRAFVSAIRPLVQSAASPAITAQMGRRNQLTGSVSYTTAVAMNANGVCPLRSDARYQRARLDISGSFTHAIGVDIRFKAAGVR